MSTHKPSPHKEHHTQTFFTGYSPMPKTTGVFLGYVVAFVTGILITLGLLWGVIQSDPGQGGFQGHDTLTGTLTIDPYPILYEHPSEKYPQGRSILLVGIGKNGVTERVQNHHNQQVNITGQLIVRDQVTMLQVSPRDSAIVEANVPNTSTIPPTQHISSSVHLRGEIVDAKCFLGAMRPGRGKKHMSCAQLCLLGEIPPLFITTAPDGGLTYFLLTTTQGENISELVHDYVSLAVSVTGALERRGNLFVLRVDPERVEVL